MTRAEAKALAQAVDKGGFSDDAIYFAEETGSDIVEDITDVIFGALTKEALLDFCLSEAAEDRVQGARAYVSAVCACAQRAVVST